MMGGVQTSIRHLGATRALKEFPENSGSIPQGQPIGLEDAGLKNQEDFSRTNGNG